MDELQSLLFFVHQENITWYHEGSDALKEARFWIAEYSLPRLVYTAFIDSILMKTYILMPFIYWTVFVYSLLPNNTILLMSFTTLKNRLIENMVGKGANTSNQHSLLFP